MFWVVTSWDASVTTRHYLRAAGEKIYMNERQRWQEGNVSFYNETKRGT